MSPFNVRPGLWRTTTVVSTVAMLATAGSLWMTYSTANQQVLDELGRITETAADLIESVAQVQRPLAAPALIEDTREATLRQLSQAFALTSRRDLQGSAELLVAVSSNDGWRLLHAAAGQGFQVVAEIAEDSELAGPIRDAFGGKRISGTFIDYHGEPVLAAFAPVPSLELALVLVLNQGKTGAPFLRAAVWAALVYLVLLGALVVGYRRLSHWIDGSVEASQHQLDRVFETAPVVMVLLSSEGLIQRVNPCFEQVTGWSSSELCGRDWFETCLPPRDADRIRSLFRSDVGGKPTRNHVNPVLTRSGAEREIQWNSHIWRDAAGRVSGMLAVGIDVTDRESASEALRRSEEDYRALLNVLPLA